MAKEEFLIPFYTLKQMPRELKGYENAKEQLLEKIKAPTKEKLLKIEQSLNSLISSDKFINNLTYDRILGLVSSYANEGIAKSNFDVIGESTYAELENAKREYEILSRALEQEEFDLPDTLQLEQYKSQAAETIAFLSERTDKRFSKLKGDLFEVFLQLTVPLITEHINEEGEIHTDELLSLLTDKIMDYEVKGEKIETYGNKPRPITIRVKIEDNKDVTWSIESQGKTDVVITDTISSQGMAEKIGISAKNYKNLDLGIHLLGEGKLLGLVSQWPIDGDQQNYYYNALSIWNPQRDMGQVLKQGKILMTIQSLAGTTQKEIQAGILIVNIRENKEGERIKVFSVPQILQNTLTDIDKYYTYKYKPALPWFSKAKPRKEKSFTKVVQGAVVSIQLAKQGLGIELMSNSLK